MDPSNIQLKETLSKIRNLINKSILDKNIKDSILIPIPIIEDKINTQQIHVGLIGESSHDKVAVLNSLLNTDFFQFNASENKHRLIRTLIEHSPEQILTVTLHNGKVYNTKKNMNRLTRMFLPARYGEFSFFDKFKFFFGIHKDTQRKDLLVSEMYHNMVSSQEAHEMVSSLRLGLPLESLPEYLVIVDTPSLSLKSDMSQRTIRETVKILCDEIIVLTRAHQPFSETVTSFIKDNLWSNQDVCRVFLTGVEGLKSPQDREQVLLETSQKAESDFQISSRNVIAAPATLDVAVRGLRVATNINAQSLNAIPKDERDYMIEQYKSDLQRCFTSYNIRKETAVVEKKFVVVEDYIRFIIHLLEDTTTKNNQQIEQVRQLMVPTLSDFLRNFFNTVDIRTKTKSVGQDVIEECKKAMQDFVNSTFAQVDKASHGKNPKDTIQGVMNDKEVIEDGEKTCAKCYQSYVFKYDYVRNLYRDVFIRLESDLRRMYGIVDANLKVGQRLKPVPAIPYKMSLSTSGMTTFRLKRLFTSVSTIQSQMKSAIQNASHKFFGQIAGSYSGDLAKEIKALDTESNQIRTDLIRRYKKLVDKRIADLNAREKVLKDNNSSLASLKDIVTKVIGYDVQ